MVNLSNIVENEAQIRTLAVRFGFSEVVSILNNGSYRPGKAITLTLIVLPVPGELDLDHQAKLLATKLSQELKCKVKILALDRNPASSALLTNEAAISELFGIQSLEDIVIKERNKEDEYLDEPLAAADQYLEWNALTLEKEAEDYQRKRARFGGSSSE